MYVIEHALFSLVKNKSRNILLSVIIFTIITATVVALAIYNTTGIVIEETRLAIQSAVQVVPQRQAAGSGGQVIAGSREESELSIEQYLLFAESDYLHGSDIRESGRGVEATYYLVNPDMLSAFEAELRSKGLSENYTALIDELAFDRIASPVESLQSLSLTFLIIVLVLGAVIMILLSAIAIRERKYEIGVLRAMGMKKKNIAIGLWTEIIVITCLCFALGMVAGSVLSQPISDAIMVGQAQSSEAGSTTLADRMSQQNEQQVETINVSISAVTGVQIFVISILLASISGVISVTRITNSEPIKILMERA
jgi:putative ABC transport system permease protein